MCAGGHGRAWAACHVTEPNCGRACGRVMVCGEHMCSRTCHGGDCVLGTAVGLPSGSCGLVCGVYGVVRVRGTGV